MRCMHVPAHGHVNVVLLKVLERWVELETFGGVPVHGGGVSAGGFDLEREKLDVHHRVECVHRAGQHPGDGERNRNHKRRWTSRWSVPIIGGQT